MCKLNFDYLSFEQRTKWLNQIGVMKSKKQQVEEILLRFVNGYSKEQSIEDIYNVFYPSEIDVFYELNPIFQKSGIKLVSAEKIAVSWLEVNPSIGRMDPVPFLFNTKVFVALDGHYFGNIVRAEILAEEAMGLKLEAIGKLLVEKIKIGDFS